MVMVSAWLTRRDLTVLSVNWNVSITGKDGLREVAISVRRFSGYLALRTLTHVTSRRATANGAKPTLRSSSHHMAIATTHSPMRAPRCGARSKRTGKPCRAAAMSNGRCKVHGVKSTGPRTPEGLERIRRANWKHGYYSREAKAERSRVRAAILALRYLRNLI